MTASTVQNSNRGLSRSDPVFDMTHNVIAREVGDNLWTQLRFADH